MMCSQSNGNLSLKGLCLVMFAALPAPTVQAEEMSGQLIFNNNCRTCHSRDAGDNRLGPTLHNIVGRKAGSTDGFGFSPSLKNSNITWTPELLDKFIADPESVVPGNQMQPYGGMKDAKERAVLVKFLGQTN